MTPSEAARIMGSVKSPKKGSASAANGKLGGRPLKPLDQIPCTCASTEPGVHRWTCKRRQAEYHRQRRAKA